MFPGNGQWIMALSAFLSALSQVLLKISANKRHANRMSEYLNPHVIIAYLLLGLSLVMNTFAFQTVDYKWGPLIASTAYIYVMIISYFFLKEKMTVRKVLGGLLIVLGIIVFGM